MLNKRQIFFLAFTFIFTILFIGGCKVGEEPPEQNINYPYNEDDPNAVRETNDLTVGWISRLPRLDYVWNSKNPAVAGWPAVGQEVTWRAHVKNWASEDKKGVTYHWLLDGNKVASGSMDITAGAYVTADLPWNWTFKRHTIDFVVEPEKGNENHLLIYTDAISAGFYVEQGAYDNYHRTQHTLGIGSNSFEGWAQRQMRMWNLILEKAIFDETPEGVLDRIRIDHITIVPDYALPLVWVDNFTDFDIAQALPNNNDRTVDMQWGFPLNDSNANLDHTNSHIPGHQPYYSGFLQHEMGHARYLVDVYGFDVSHGGSKGTIEIMENGEPVPGSIYMEGQLYHGAGGDYLRVHDCADKGMMNSDWDYMDRYSAVCMNLIAGHRAISGNYNAPENIGVFLNDLPAENRFTITDEEGNILKDAKVTIYRPAAPKRQDGVYARDFDNTPDLFFTTDHNGQVLLGRCPFSKDGIISHDVPYSNAAFIMRVEHEQKVGYEIFDISIFNLEYWRGNTQLADYEAVVTLH